jgi:hypothetical protein
VLTKIEIIRVRLNILDGWGQVTIPEKQENTAIVKRFLQYRGSKLQNEDFASRCRRWRDNHLVRAEIR